MSDHEFEKPYIPSDPHQAELARAYYRRVAEEKREADRRTKANLDLFRPMLEHEAEWRGLSEPADQRSYAEKIAWLAGKQDVQPGAVSFSDKEALVIRLLEERQEQKHAESLRKEQAHKAEVERQAAEQRDQELKSAAARAEPLPGSVARFDAALDQRAKLQEEVRLGQKQRLNNADMDMLASRGPHHRDYTPLKQSPDLAGIQPASEVVKGEWRQAANEVCDRKQPPPANREREIVPRPKDRGHVPSSERGDPPPTNVPLSADPGERSDRRSSAREIMDFKAERTDRAQLTRSREILDYNREQTDLRQTRNESQNQHENERFNERGRGGRMR